MDELSVKCSLYADDQVIPATSACGLLEMRNKMNDSVNKRGIKSEKSIAQFVRGYGHNTIWFDCGSGLNASPSARRSMLSSNACLQHAAACIMQLTAEARIWFSDFKRGHVNLSDEFRDGRSSTAVNNKNIDTMRCPVRVEVTTVVANAITRSGTDRLTYIPKHECCARGRPIIVEWERDARHSAGPLSRSDSLYRRRPRRTCPGAAGCPTPLTYRLTRAASSCCDPRKVSLFVYTACYV
ncbi:hypothetical protein EVAR_40394_1 [Eumeta japonica]|uniref:Reverse transcriptase domain-containing protein n=1 Tax=Eumeta variegata TaxID=151549 RepID=A0A4C1WAR5_EUMVA|nr:hypothetical protein EVAR_40394_1 [Eumeta japonica]